MSNNDATTLLFYVQYSKHEKRQGVLSGKDRAKFLECSKKAKTNELEPLKMATLCIMSWF